MTEIEPGDISTDSRLWGTFDNLEREITAYWIIRLCQERKGWLPFTYEAIDTFYSEHGPGDGFLFNGIVAPEYGICKRGQEYHIRDAFTVRVSKHAKRQATKAPARAEFERRVSRG